MKHVLNCPQPLSASALENNLLSMRLLAFACSPFLLWLAHGGLHGENVPDNEQGDELASSQYAGAITLDVGELESATNPQLHGQEPSH